MEFESKPVPVTAIQWGGKVNEIPGLTHWIREDRIDLQTADVVTKYTECISFGCHPNAKRVQALIEIDQYRLYLEPGDYIVKMGPSIFACPQAKFKEDYQKRSSE